MFKVSLLNRVVGATITGAGSDPAYPAANAASPDRPFQPWKSTDLGGHALVVDFGAAVTLDTIALIRTNFATPVIYGNATDSWGAPSYSQTVTVGRNLISSRYHHVHAIVGSFNYRYLRIQIQPQSTLDGASVYLLGGIWAGVWTVPPRGFRWGYALDRIEPVLDQRTLSGALHRLRLGEPIAHATAQRQALLTTSPPGLNDQLAAWAEFDRKMADADSTLVWWEPTDPAQGWIMRRLAPPAWTVGSKKLAEGSFELEEIIAGGGA